MSIYNQLEMILAGDIGGTKTLIGLFDPGPRRPVPVDVREYPTLDYAGLPEIIEEFYRAQRARPEITSAAFGVAGPVIDQAAEMTNVPWRVEAAELKRRFAFPHIRLLNDLEAMAYSLTTLDQSELTPLQRGIPRPDGNIALIAAGTGLGQAVLHWTGDRHVPLPSEGGHADFAGRTDRELDFVRYLRDRYGRAEIEHVLSGPGLLNLSQFTHQARSSQAGAHQGDPPDDPAEVSAAALRKQCPQCVEALDMFVSALGASAGNLALNAVTTGGVFIGGGIAPRILPAFESGGFLAAFNDKGPMRPLLEGMPVQIILNPESGLLGAAIFAKSNAR